LEGAIATMSRIALIIGLIVLAGLFAWANLRQNHQISVSEATISRMMDGSIMESAKITNGGEADVLIAASARGFDHAHFMGTRGSLVVPGNAAPVLASDGAHVMMSGRADLSTGELVPLILTFQNAGSVNARAKIVEMTMDHSNMPGIERADIDLGLSLDVDENRGGLTGEVEVSGLQLIARPDDFGHVDGEGHAHVYLNGLKLQRLYENAFTVGPLSPGIYVLRVTLNANDHKPYLKGGAPISVEQPFTID
jgi:copper(I)-binding protein